MGIFQINAWAAGVIAPIYKSGDKSNPGNYRGITLTSTMSKLFTYILNECVLKWPDFHQLSSQSQFAYKPEYNVTAFRRKQGF